MKYKKQIKHVKKTIPSIIIFMLIIGLLQVSFIKIASADTVPFTGDTDDGYIMARGLTYDEAHDASSGTVVDNYYYLYIGQQYFSKFIFAPPDPRLASYSIYRGFVYFDTSSIPAKATITSVSLKLITCFDFSGTDFDVRVIDGQPTYPHKPLQGIDYAISHYSGNGGSWSTASYPGNGIEITIPLNSNGISWIQKGAGAVTKFALLSSRDINGDIPIPQEPLTYAQEYVTFYSANSAGNEPELEVTYTTNSPPNTPSQPAGPNSRNTGQSGTYSTSATDPDGNQVQYRFDWDDGTYSSWTSLVNSGTSSSRSHSWTNPGTYIVRAQARDSNGATSSWSNGLTVTVTTPINPPTITNNNGATSITQTQATLNGRVTNNGGENPTCIIYWGDNNGGTTPSNWDNNINMGIQSGSFQTTVTGLSEGTTYYYRCYGSNSGGNDWADNTETFTTESAPNNPPNPPNNPTPANGATDISLNPTLNVDVSDPDGNNMDVTFYDASDNSIIGTHSNVASGNTASTSWSGLSYSTSYSWYAIADDGIDSTQSSTWTFTTQSTPNNPPNPPNNPTPANGATDISLNPTLNVDVSDPDGNNMDVTFYDASDNSIIGTENNVASGSSASVQWLGLNYDTSYSWYAIADDGQDTATSSTFSFNTILNICPDEPINPSPASGATDQPTSITLSIYVEDDNGDTMTVTFYNTSDDSVIGTDSISGSGTATTTWNGLANDRTYEWYVIADDGICTTKSNNFIFTTTLISPPTITFIMDDAADTLTVAYVDPSDVLWSDIEITGICDTSGLGTYVAAGDVITSCYDDIILVFTPTGTILGTFSFSPAPPTCPEKPINPSPSNGATGVDTNPTLSVEVNDINGDNMTVTFYDASDDSIIGTHINVTSKSRVSASWSGRSYSTTYSWYAIANDSEFENKSDTWSFTTKSSGGGGDDDDDDDNGDGANTNTAPTADAGGPYTGIVDKEIIFDGSRSSDAEGPITGYKWYFEDDETYNTDWLTEPTIARTYSSVGIYTVKLQVKDNMGATSSIDTATVNISEASGTPPTADAGGPYAGLTYQNITFDGSGSYDDKGIIVNYTWNFDDGTIAYGEKVVHSYNTSGVFNVTLTVKDDDGLTNSNTTTATITLDTDGDGWSDEIEESYETNTTDPNDYPQDTDNDGTPDEGSSDGKYIGDLDDDNDGLEDKIEEMITGSDPKNKDDVKLREDGKYDIDFNVDSKVDGIYDPVTQKFMESGKQDNKTKKAMLSSTLMIIAAIISTIIVFAVALLYNKHPQHITSNMGKLGNPPIPEILGDAILFEQQIDKIIQEAKQVDSKPQNVESKNRNGLLVEEGVINKASLTVEDKGTTSSSANDSSYEHGPANNNKLSGTNGKDISNSSVNNGLLHEHVLVDDKQKTVQRKNRTSPSRRHDTLIYEHGSTNGKYKSRVANKKNRSDFSVNTLGKNSRGKSGVSKGKKLQSSSRKKAEKK